MKYLLILIVFLYSCASAEEIAQNNKSKENFEELLNINSKTSVCSKDDFSAYTDCIGVTNKGIPVKYICQYNTCTLVY